HPRFSRWQCDPASLGAVLSEAARLELVVFYCTYWHSRIETLPDQDPFLMLTGALKAAPSCKVVLLHGGTVNLLSYAELVRFKENLILDLSLTIMKYERSSIDRDIDFLFHRFDRRICIGSDHPEYSHAQLRTRFEHFSHDLPEEKAANIGHRNIMRFL